MEPLKLELTLQETNLILEALGKLPFIQVHELIAKIQQQASTQLKTNENGSNKTSVTQK